MGPTWVLSAPDGPHVGPWTLLSGILALHPPRRFYNHPLHTQFRNLNNGALTWNPGFACDIGFIPPCSIIKLIEWMASQEGALNCQNMYMAYARSQIMSLIGLRTYLANTLRLIIAVISERGSKVRIKSWELSFRTWRRPKPVSLWQHDLHARSLISLDCHPVFRRQTLQWLQLP